MFIDNFRGELFHVVTVKPMQLNQKLTFGDKPNYFYERLFNKDFILDNLDVLQMTHTKEFQNLSDSEIRLIKNYIYESAAITREMALENYRIKYFRNYPSRLTCMFLTNSYEQALNWATIIQRMNKKQKPLQVVKLKVEGKVFVGDGNLMLRNTLSINSKFEIAKSYWENKSECKEEEILFEGNAEVIEILNDYQ